MSVGSRPTSVGERRFAGRRILEIPVWVVFDDYDVKFDTNGVDVLTALDTEGPGSRILTDSALPVS